MAIQKKNLLIIIGNGAKKEEPMKKILKILTSLFLVFSLTGCMKYKMNIHVDSNGKASTDLKILLSTDFIKNYLKTTNKKVEETFKSSVRKSSSSAKISYTSETHNGIKYVGIKATDSDSKAITSKVQNGKVTVTIPVENITNALTSSGIDTSSLSNGTYSYQSLEAAGVEVSMSVTMPGTPTTNVGTVKDHTVKIDLLKEMMKTKSKRVTKITITSDTNSSTIYYIIGGIVAAILLVVLIIVYARKQSKKKKESLEEQLDEVADEEDRQDRDVDEDAPEGTPEEIKETAIHEDLSEEFREDDINDNDDF